MQAARIRLERFAIVALTIWAALACSAKQHTPEPYRSDPSAAVALSSRAAAYCAEAVRGAPPDRPFTSDGCTLFPDTDWDLQCCIEHDIKYWCGGSAEQRDAADAEFGECVGTGAGKAVGTGLELGLRFSGHPVWPAGYRWGYGRDYSPGYREELRSEEP